MSLKSIGIGILFLFILAFPVIGAEQNQPHTEMTETPSQEDVLGTPVEEVPSSTVEPQAPKMPMDEPVEESEAQMDTIPEEAIVAIPKNGSLHDIVVMKNVLKLSPDKITVKTGDTIRWTNQDGRKHFLASIPGSGPTEELEIFALMEPGKIYQHTFSLPGEYPYFCFIHNQMTGHVTVLGKGS